MSKIAETIIKKDYIVSALSVYKFITPRVYGIPTVSVMKRGLRKLAKAEKVSINKFPLVKPYDVVETADYIKEGLRKNCPIMMLTWNSNIHSLIYHWVNITGYYRTINGEHYAIISNYGVKEVISIDEWVQERSIYKGLLYFIIQWDY